MASKGKVYIGGTESGRVFEPQDAVISVYDRGFLYGDSIYETMRVFEGVPFAFDAHMRRFVASGARIGYPLPWTLEHIQEAVAQTIRASGLADAYLRIIGTRGAGPVGLDPALAISPQLIVIVQELPHVPAAAYETGRTARLVSVHRNLKTAVDPAAKTGNYMNSVLAAHEARERGADEAIMLDVHGRVAESSAANIFALVGETWVTPPLDVGILAGITRQTILDLCKKNHIEAQERVLMPDDLFHATEVFLSASVKEVMALVRIDDKPVGSGKVGPKTKQIASLYRAEVKSQIAAEKARGRF